MRRKGIWVFAASLLAAVPAAALEERLTLEAGSAQPSGGDSRILGAWSSEGGVLGIGFKAKPDYRIEDDAYAATEDVDLLVHFDDGVPVDACGNWKAEAGRAFAADSSRAVFGSGSGSFRGGTSALTLSPGPRSQFSAKSTFRDFSIEFWLYPANAENGETILLWQSIRTVSSRVATQRISCGIAAGRLAWNFVGFFCAPDGSNSSVPVELRARSPLVPRTWSHHLVRFDSDTGLVEYLVNGLPEATAYATRSGGEGGAVYVPMIGTASPLQFCPGYTGLADELRISRTIVETPALLPYGGRSAFITSPVADLGYGNSHLVAIEAEAKIPGATSIEFAYRIADSWVGWKKDKPAWIPLKPGEKLPDSARGRFVQVRAVLYPDGTGRLTPTLSSITLRYEPDPPPPAPAKLLAAPRDGAVELRWTMVPEADIAGYLIYYGERPGEYSGTGADQGPSPIDAGLATSITITGVPNGKLFYFAVAAYDSAPALSAAGAALAPRQRAIARAGEFSPETSARPTKKADR
jgi:hypothetical protein